MWHASNGSTTITRRECIGFLNQSTSWTLTSLAPSGFVVNPGVVTTFPWLSQVAQNYEQYAFRYLRFFFKSTCSDSTTATTNNNLGVVIFQMTYDIYDAPPTSRLEQLNYYGTTRAKPSENLALDVNVRSTVTSLFFVRGVGEAISGDQRLYDIGTLYVATDGAQNSNQCGELWVDYSVNLYKPKLADALGVTIPTTKASFTGSSNTAWFGTAQTYAVNGLNASVDAGGDNVTVPPQPNRRFLFIYTTKFDAVAFSHPAFTFTNCTAGENYFAPGSGSTTTSYMVYYIITCTPGVAFTIGITSGSGTAFTTPTGTAFWITPIDDDSV